LHEAGRIQQPGPVGQIALLRVGFSLDCSIGKVWIQDSQRAKLIGRIKTASPGALVIHDDRPLAAVNATVQIKLKATRGSALEKRFLAGWRHANFMRNNIRRVEEADVVFRRIA
jgi:hypothetical protein